MSEFQKEAGYISYPYTFWQKFQNIKIIVFRCGIFANKIIIIIIIIIIIFVFLPFLGPLLWHMEVPRLGV